MRGETETRHALSLQNQKNRQDSKMNIGMCSGKINVCSKQIEVIDQLNLGN